MRNSNIARIDSKGRVLIPIHIRKFMEADEGTELVIVPDGERGQVKMLPLLRDKTAEFRLMLSDDAGSLAKVASMLSDYNVNIIMSESRTLVKGKNAEWDVIVDTSECNGNLKRLKDELINSRAVRTMEIMRG